MAIPDALLQSIPLFTPLAESERRRLASEVVESRHAQGDFIFHEGDPAEYFHIVKAGAVKCIKSCPDGREMAMKVLMPGDLFCCEAAVFDGGVHPGCAQSMGETTILRFSKDTYLDILRRNPNAALEVIRYLGRRLNEAQENAKVLALDRADQRLAALLVDLASRIGVQEPDGVRLTIRLTRQDLASLTGLSVETVIRILSRFKRARLMSGTAKRLMILDLAQLKTIASPGSSPTAVPKPA